MNKSQEQQKQRVVEGTDATKSQPQSSFGHAGGKAIDASETTNAQSPHGIVGSKVQNTAEATEESQGFWHQVKGTFGSSGDKSKEAVEFTKLKANEDRNKTDTATQDTVNSGNQK